MTIPVIENSNIDPTTPRDSKMGHSQLRIAQDMNKIQRVDSAEDSEDNMKLVLEGSQFEIV